MKKRGRGVALVHYPGGLCGGGDTTQAFIKIKPDGGADLFLGSAEIGQGVKTIAVQILSEELGIPYDQIKLNNRSTDECGICTGSFCSRVTYFAGNAIIEAAEDVKGQLFEVAAGELETSPEKLAIREGEIYVKNEPENCISISDVALTANFEQGRLIVGKGYFWQEPGEVYDEENGQKDLITFLSYGATVAEVEVDTVTGKVTVEKMTNIFDTGKTINPMLAKGQVDGGAVMGVSSTLMEDLFPYYPDDKHRPDNLSDYVLPTAADIPELDSDFIECAEPEGPYGAKGIGEMTANTASPAIVNAIYDAVEIWIEEIPVTPEKILRKLEEKKD